MNTPIIQPSSSMQHRDNNSSFAQQNTTRNCCSGYCSSCNKLHYLPMGPAKAYCLKLMDLLLEKKRIDLSVADHHADPRFSTNYLYGHARGQMFAVMVFKDKNGLLGTIPAFSGQFNGSWLVTGWAPPLFDVDLFYKTTQGVEKEIKRLGGKLADLIPGSRQYIMIVEKRKSLSQKLMKEIHAIYAINNFCGVESSIFNAFNSKRGIPSGTGDCCAPKLLNYAAVHNLTPLGIAEFYWGKENKSKTRKHSVFYPSCQEKCAPILGFMLCGLSNK